MMLKGVLLGILSGFLFIPSIIYAQDASAYFTSELGTPLVGEPVSLSLTIRVPAGSTVNLPVFPQEWPPFVVREVGAVSQQTEADYDIYVQKLTVLLWSPGDYQTPLTVVEYQPPGSTQVNELEIQPVFYTVKSVLNPDDSYLRPSKPPIALFYISPWLLMLLVLPLIGAVAYFWRSRARLVRSVGGWRTDDKMHVVACQALIDLKGVNTRNWSGVKIYSYSSDVLRRYIQGRFGAHALDMTTEELLSNLTLADELSERRQRELSYLLGQADLVKFADVQPQSAEKILNVAQRWIIAVEQEQMGTSE